MFGRATIRLGIGPHSSCLIYLMFSARLATVLHRDEDFTIIDFLYDMPKLFLTVDKFTKAH